MKKSTILTFLWIFSSLLSAQNLVLNPSFENINVTCSGFAGAGYTNIVNWDNPDPTDTCSTPDWFSTCLNSFFPTSAPTSWLGYQMPRTGDAYAGIILYDATTNAYREYLEGTLASPLVAGQTYCVSFYISLADTVPYAVNSIGVHFSNSFVQFPVSHCVSHVPLPNTPQLQWAGATLTNDSTWTRIEWQYVATGGEQYFVIGNFNTNANTTVANTSGTGFFNPFAYYFIDDVSVTAGICCDASILPQGALCTNGTSVNLSANTLGGTWSGTGITSAASGTFDPTVAGLGTHIITYNLACGGSDTISLVVQNCMEVCQDSSGNWNVSGGTGPYTWQNQVITQNCSACIIGCTFPPGCAVNVTTWQNYATGASVAPPTAFPIQVTDNSGQTLQINSLASVTPCSTVCTLAATATSTSVACNNNKTGTATVTATGGTGPYLYTWNSGQTAANIGFLGAGTYTCIVFDAGSCSTSVTVSITQAPALAISTSSSPNTGGPNGTASVTVSGGVAPYTYTWQTTPLQYTQTITGLTAGIYACVVRDANNCAKIVTDTVHEFISINPQLLGIETFSLTPNPSNGQFDVDIELTNIDNIAVTVYDLSGKAITEDVQNHIVSYAHTFHLENLSRGIYILKVKTSKGEFAEKIVIQ